MNKNKNIIDFKKSPYRGVFTKVADKLQITKEGVRQAYWRNSSDIVKMVNKEIKRINTIIREKDQLLQDSNDFGINKAG